jgi:hypothetical protein
MQTKYENALSFIETYGWNDKKLRKADNIIPLVATMLELYADGQQLKHGGSRPGAGRPKKEPTTTVSFRVKTKYKPKIVKVVTAEIKRLEGDG